MLVIDLLLKATCKALSDKDISLEISKGAKNYILEKGTDLKYGARPLRRAIQNEIEDALSEKILEASVKKGDKVAILLMNCLEWLPIYFGILKTGALVVPMNYRYSSDEIKYCLDLADVRMLVFGPEFIERINAIQDDMGMVDNLFFMGKRSETPAYADNYADCDRPRSFARDSNSRVLYGGRLYRRYSADKPDTARRTFHGERFLRQVG